MAWLEAKAGVQDDAAQVLGYNLPLVFVLEVLMSDIIKLIAQEIKVKDDQVERTIALLDEGATVPFIARYRKEVTGGLDDTQLRHLEERLIYLRELEERRAVILKSIAEQDKLTPELTKAINEADTKTRLEDLYLPYKPKRRTKAQIAREAGLDPLAQQLWDDRSIDPQTLAATFVDDKKGVADAKAALEGARHILMEQFAENADLLASLRDYLWKNALLTATVIADKKSQASKYKDYFEYSEAIRKVPSHRALAILRGRKEGFLTINLTMPESIAEDFAETMIAEHVGYHDQQGTADAWMQETIRWTWKVKLFTKLEVELVGEMREAAEGEAINVFSHNLRDLLLAAPAGQHVTMGLDPGIRTGVKVVVVDATGKLEDYATVYPFAPHNQLHEAIATLAKLCSKYHVTLISIGNGTASRETERMVAELIKMYADLPLQKIVVSEAGASVYSASELAAKEFPDLDVSLRGAVSIARRLQDPLAELVKIDPKSIGVGQYQHDVNQVKLGRGLENVVEDCVNAVGVDVNTASAAILRRISGLNDTLAQNIVSYRDEHGAFKTREQLHAVPRMGEKTFQQAAGFLRIVNGDNPLDASAVHPEAYPVVEKILASKKTDIKKLIGNGEFLHAVNASEFTDDHFGLPTVIDILKELEKPGRDPRPEFKTAQFKEGVETIKDLAEDMILEGVVSNVTNFGAFVDIGVHQDGLVHISELTDKFVDDPRKVVKAGDIVTVRVMNVDKERRRISLSMKLKKAESKAPAPKKAPPRKPAAKRKPEKKRELKEPFNPAMADAFAKLKEKMGDS